MTSWCVVNFTKEVIVIIGFSLKPKRENTPVYQKEDSKDSWIVNSKWLISTLSCKCCGRGNKSRNSTCHNSSSFLRVLHEVICHSHRNRSADEATPFVVITKNGRVTHTINLMSSWTIIWC